MGKIAKPKKRETSVHSRAFRRNATPPLEVPKSKNKSEDKEHWMYNAQNAGVHKKTKSKRGATRGQHTRHAKALEKADRNAAVLESKIAKSKVKGKSIVERAKDWDELNEELTDTANPKEKDSSAQRSSTTAMEGIDQDDVENIQPTALSTVEQSSNDTSISEQSAEPIDTIT